MRQRFLAGNWKPLSGSWAAGAAALGLLFWTEAVSGPEDVISAVHDAAALCGGFALFIWGFGRLKMKRLIENIPRSTARSVAMGLCEVTGAAQPKEIMNSPLTRTKCVYYRFTVEVEKPQRRSTRWVVVNHGESTNYFYVRDATGKVLVDPLDAEIVLPHDYRYIEAAGAFSSKKRFTEWYIVPGDTIYVIGTAKKFPGAMADRKTRLAERLRQIKQDKARLAELDLDKDGSISPEEWDRAVAQAEDELLREDLQNPPAPGEDLIVAKGEFEDALLISDRSEKDLTGRLAWQSGGGVAGGMALMIGMMISLAARAGALPVWMKVPWRFLYD